LRARTQLVVYATETTGTGDDCDSTTAVRDLEDAGPASCLRPGRGGCLQCRATAVGAADGGRRAPYDRHRSQRHPVLWLQRAQRAGWRAAPGHGRGRRGPSRRVHAWRAAHSEHHRSRQLVPHIRQPGGGTGAPAGRLRACA